MGRSLDISVGRVAQVQNARVLAVFGSQKAIISL